MSLQICSRVSLEYDEEVVWESFHQHCWTIQSPSTSPSVNGWSQSGISCSRSPEAASRFQIRECTGQTIWGLGKTLLLYHLFDDEFELVQSWQPLQFCHWLLEVCGSLEVLPPCLRKCSRCHDFAFCKSGCLVVATVCLLHTQLFASGSLCFSNGHALLQRRRVLFFGPLALRSHHFTFASVIPSDWWCTRYRSSSRYRSRMQVLPLFLGTLEMVTRFVIQFGAFAATNRYLWGFPVLKTNALVVSSLRQFKNVFENLFLDFFTCSWISLSTCAICWSRSFTLVTRLALYCDHEHFMSFDVTLFSNKIHEVLRKTLGIIPSSFDFCLETQEPAWSTTLSMSSFPGPRFLATVLILLVPVLVPHIIASSLPELLH